jgi:hypothetical protein
MRIPLRCPAPVLVVTAGFGGNSPGAWQFGAVHGTSCAAPVPAERQRLIMHTNTNALLLAGGLLAAAPAAAQTYDPRYPVCIEVFTVDGSTIDCSFTSMAQCTATAIGQAAQCYANPYAVQIRQPGLGPSPPRRNR